jgi:arylsulfatase A-like enzyme
MKNSMTRRSFVEQVALAAGIAATGSGALLESLGCSAAAAPPAAPNLIANPNILMIAVDELRLPSLWLNSAQQATVDEICPNIAWLRKTSYSFPNFYIAAQACSPSRGTILTGLYAPQTGFFITQEGSNDVSLNPGFPTFGTALADIAGYDPANIMWFGKWHASNFTGYLQNGVDTLPKYGFNTGRSQQILWPSYYGSPNGSANQGMNGYLYNPPSSPAGDLNYVFGACDDSIANDFKNNWVKNPPLAGKPWYACVSFVNPHDIQFYPGYFPLTAANPNGMEAIVPGSQGFVSDSPSNVPPNLGYQPKTANYTTQLFPPGQLPDGFNYESTQSLAAKSWNASATVQDPNNFLQPFFQHLIADSDANPLEGSPAVHATILGADSYADFLNWYYYLISLVDTNIGTVLSTVLGPAFSNTVFTNPSSNTKIVFISDHGDYGGSHGLHAKAGAAYDESLRVPLYVVTPGQSHAVALNQMCSMVDIFKLVVELALGTQYSGWETNPKYLDQYFNQNQSIFSFIQNQATVETRGFWDISVTPNVWHPFILTTTDEFGANALPWTNPVKYNYNPALRSHLICMRTKSDASEAGLINPYGGGKLVIYSKWADVPQSYFAPIVDGTLASGGAIVQDYEYYDYQNYQNRTEVSYLLNGNQTGSDYPPALTARGASRGWA